MVECGGLDNKKKKNKVLLEERRGEKKVRGFKAEEGEELSICTNLRICHVSDRVFFAAASRWF